MNRRGFLRSLGMGLATLAITTRLATAKVSPSEPPKMEGDFDTENLRFKSREVWTLPSKPAYALGRDNHRMCRHLVSIDPATDFGKYEDVTVWTLLDDHGHRICDAVPDDMHRFKRGS